MASVKYLVKRILNMNYKQMLDSINRIHKETGKSRVSIFLDMKDCAVKYGAGYTDYDLYEMYNLTDEQRDTYITRGRSNDLVLKYNQRDYAHYIEEKKEFNVLFSKYLKRDWVDVDTFSKEDVIAFLEKHPDFLSKPNDGTCGQGIEKLHTSDFESLDAVYNYLYGKNCELEEIVIQNEEVAKIYPGSINTARVVTVLKDGVVHVVVAVIRIGNGGFVDNFHAGGMTAPVDVKTGVVLESAQDKDKNLFEVHPLTGYKIKGFKFPEWEEALEMVKEAALIVPQMGYVGWDVAFSTKGPLLIEANDFPAHSLYQLPAHTKDKVGVWPLFNNI